MPDPDRDRNVMEPRVDRLSKHESRMGEDAPKEWEEQRAEHGPEFGEQIYQSEAGGGYSNQQFSPGENFRGPQPYNEQAAAANAESVGAPIWGPKAEDEAKGPPPQRQTGGG